MDNFKKASQLKLRFNTNKGVLSVEQLWDLTATSLATLVRSIKSELKNSTIEDELSFLSDVIPTKIDVENILRFEIAKDVYLRVKKQSSYNSMYKDFRINEFIVNNCNDNSFQRYTTNVDNLKKHYDNEEITFEQFKKYVLKQDNMFTIEDLKKEKNGKWWVVRITNKENHAKLKAIFPKMYEFVNSIFYYLVATNNAGSSCDKTDYPSTNYNVINFEDIDFREEKKIIGYKLVKPEYAQAARAIMTFNPNKSIGSSSDFAKAFKEAGVLDLWFEPVYEPEKPKEELISIGSFNLKVTKEGIFHKYENITSYVNHINNFFKLDNFGFSTNKGDKNWTFIVKDIVLSKTGCESSETTVSQWLKVWDKYQEFQK